MVGSVLSRMNYQGLQNPWHRFAIVGVSLVIRVCSCCDFFDYLIVFYFPFISYKTFIMLQVIYYYFQLVNQQLKEMSRLLHSKALFVYYITG